jgi:sigma-B regulation protein RsbU (phosphoserine phosphatase)
MGIWGTYEYQSQECYLEDSSILFLYTDGINESENHNKELFSNERMLQSLLSNYKADTQTIVEGLLNDVKDHAKDTPQSDDITVLCCRYNSPLHNEGKALFKVKLKNEISELEQMNAFVDEIGEALNLPAEEVFQIRLAMEEAVANVILYAYPKGESNIVELEAQSDSDILTIQIIDYGIEFDPTEAKEADITLSSEERPIGGLGIFLIRQIMDSVEYQRVDGRNILLITKKLNDKKSNI